MRAKFFLVVLVAFVITIGLVTSNAFSEEKKDEGIEQNQAEPETENAVMKPVKGMAAGVTQVVKGPKKFISETVEGTKSGPPVIGTVEGVGKASGALVDSTVKGAYKVATLGYGEAKTVEVENPEKPKDGKDGLDPSERKPTKFKIAF